MYLSHFACILLNFYTNLYENQKHNQGGYKQKTAYIPLKTIIFSVKVVKDCSATFLTSKKSQPLTTETLFLFSFFPLYIHSKKLQWTGRNGGKISTGSTLSTLLGDKPFSSQIGGYIEENRGFYKVIDINNRFISTFPPNFKKVLWLNLKM